MSTIDEVMEQQNRALHNALSDGFNPANYERNVSEDELVSLDDVLEHQNRAHITHGDELEGKYEADLSDPQFVTLDDFMEHQNRAHISHSDGFKTEDYEM